MSSPFNKLKKSAHYASTRAFRAKSGYDYITGTSERIIFNFVTKIFKLSLKNGLKLLLFFAILIGLTIWSTSLTTLWWGKIITGIIGFFLTLIILIIFFRKLLFTMIVESLKFTLTKESDNIKAFLQSPEYHETAADIKKITTLLSQEKVTEILTNANSRFVRKLSHTNIFQKVMQSKTIQTFFQTNTVDLSKKMTSTQDKQEIK